MAHKRPVAVPKEPPVPIAAPSWWAVGLFAVAVLVYLCLFYLTNEKRGIVLPFLLAPDVLARTWAGNDFSRVAPADHLLVLAPAALILGVSFLTGRLALDILRVDRLLDSCERFVFATAIGLNAWSLIALAIGLAGWLSQRWLFGAVAVAVMICAAWRWPHWRRVASANTGRPVAVAMDTRADDRWRWLEWPCWVVGGFFAAWIVWQGTMPATHFDVREYHLQVPKEWFLQGRVTFLPHNVYGNMPMGAEMQAVLGMVLFPGPDGWWWGSLVGKTLIAAAAPLAALGIYSCGRRFVSSPAGTVAAFVYITTPWIAHVSANGLIDGVSALYMLLAVYAALLRTAEIASRVDSPWSDAGLVCLSGFLAGAGVACKYPAVLFLVAPLVLFVLNWQFRRWDFRAAAVFSFAVLLGCGLWFGKNAVLAGNPTYPLLYQWLDGKSWTEEQDARWTKAHGPPRDGDGRSYTPHQLGDSVLLVGLTSDFLGPAMWPLAMLAWYLPAKRRMALLLLAYLLWTAAVWWLATHRLDRFLVPLLPLVCLLSGIGAVSKIGQQSHFVVALLLAWTALNGFVMDATPLSSDVRVLVSLRELRDDLPHPADPEMTRMHRAHRYLNQHVRPGYRALLVGEAQVFDLQVPILYNTCFDECIFERLLRDKSREQRLAALRERRISHIYFFWRELDRYRSPGNYGYSSFPTRQLVRQELAQDQELIRRVPLELDPDSGEIYEVIGWESWE